MSKNKIYRRSHAKVYTADQLYSDLSLTTSECDNPDDPTMPCTSQKTLEAVKKYVSMQEALNRDLPTENLVLPTANTEEAKIIQKAAKSLQCKSESCILSHPKFRKFAATLGMSEDDIETELKENFKPIGPRDNVDLLSNIDIDSILQQWAKKFNDFYPCPFAMMDFIEHRDVFLLDRISLPNILDGKVLINLGNTFITRKSSCFGCVINTDKSNGVGKHWVSVFVDCRPDDTKPWTVEYFDSVGDPPMKPIIYWMVKTRASLELYRKRINVDAPVDEILVTEIDHQLSETECGVYSLYYIRRRLEGYSYKFFTTKIIPDEYIQIFRKYLFRATKNK